MNDPAPLPQPSGATCPNCGAAQSADAPYCTNCGAPLRAAASGSMSGGAKTIASCALFFGALVFGGVGGCFALLGGAEGFDSAFALFIIVPALACLACLVGIFLVLRK